jgi:phosphoglycerate transport regulatory protein PgtC
MLAQKISCRQALALLLLFLLAVAAGPARAEPRGSLVIVTSFPPSMFAPFCAAFEARYPEVTTLVRSKKTAAALTFIAERPEEPADLVWASAPDAFELLRDGGHLEAAFPPLGEATARFDGYPLDDPQGYYRGFALSGYGLMWNRPYLQRLELPPPSSWAELALPRYAGHVAITTPSRSGTMHLIVETILQSQGWEEGWATLLQLAGNLATITARSFGVPEGVVAGRFGIGATIDFFGLAAKASGAPVDFVYPEGTLFLPASIALAKRSANREAAMAFVDFVLSGEGQSLLCQPEISRLPISSAAYATAPAGFPNPYTMKRDWPALTFDVGVSRLRYHLVNALFDSMLTYRQQPLRRVWTTVHRVEAELQHRHRPELHQPLATVKKLLVLMPVSDEESRAGELAGIFRRRSPGMASSSPQTILERQWQEFAGAHLEEAELLLAEILDSLAEGGK